jgi:hypothetical protein
MPEKEKIFVGKRKDARKGKDARKITDARQRGSPRESCDRVFTRHSSRGSCKRRPQKRTKMQEEEIGRDGCNECIYNNLYLLHHSRGRGCFAHI